MAEKVKRYMVSTPNKQFSGKVCGVQFGKGRAIVEELTIDKSLGRSVEEIAKMLENDFGYVVEEVK